MTLPRMQSNVPVPCHSPPAAQGELPAGQRRGRQERRCDQAGCCVGLRCAVGAWGLQPATAACLCAAAGCFRPCNACKLSPSLPPGFNRAVTRPAPSSAAPPPPAKAVILPVRLSGTDSPLEGRLEVQLNGRWGTVSQQPLRPRAPAAATCCSVLALPAISPMFLAFHATALLPEACRCLLVSAGGV